MTRPNRSNDGPSDRSSDPDRSPLLAAPRRTFLGAGATIAGLFGLERFASDSVLASEPNDPSSRPRSNGGDTRGAYTSVQAAAVRTEFSDVARLENGRAVVELPDHFGRVTSDAADLIVQVTPYGGDRLTVTGRSLDRIVVEAPDGTGNDEFALTVKGIRDGYENRPAIRERTEAAPPDPRGGGPSADGSGGRPGPAQPTGRHDIGDPQKPPRPGDRPEHRGEDENDDD